MSGADGDLAAMAQAAGLPDISAALQLFDETTRALDARARRLEQVLMAKQRELEAAHGELQQRYQDMDRMGRYLNLVLGSVASGVIAIDSNATITTCNRVGRSLLAGSSADPVGANYRELFPASPLLDVLAGRVSSASYERHLPIEDGREAAISAKASPIIDAHGAIIGAVEVFEDVSEVRRLREQVERGERLQALGEMAAGVAHEIRNPLNGIEGFASLLERDLGEDPSKARYAHAIVEGVRHLNETVTGLLAFTRPTMPKRRPIPIRQLLDDCIALVRAEHGVFDGDEDGMADEEQALAAVPEITCVADFADLRISCDGTQIRQVLLNLLQNAIQACVEAASPYVQVHLRSEPGYVRICVADNGPGIPPEARQRIFTPFFTTKDHGTGLGLAIAHKMVELHDGSLAVEESELGGAAFVLRLPVEAS